MPTDHANLFTDKFLSLEEMTWIVAAERQRYRQKQKRMKKEGTFNCYVLDNGSVLGFNYDASNKGQSELDEFLKTLAEKPVASIQPCQVLYKTDDHWSTISIHVMEGKLHFFLIDAANFIAPIYKTMLLLHKHFSDAILTYCGLGIQKDSESCGYFALRDALFLTAFDNFHEIIKTVPSDPKAVCAPEDENFLRQCGFSMTRNGQALNKTLKKVYFLQPQELPKNFGSVLKTIQTRSTYDKHYANQHFYIKKKEKDLDTYVKKHMTFTLFEKVTGKKTRLINNSASMYKKKVQNNTLKYIECLSVEAFHQIQEERKKHKQMLNSFNSDNNFDATEKNNPTDCHLERRKYIIEALKEAKNNLLNADIFYTLTKLDPVLFYDAQSILEQCLENEGVIESVVNDYFHSQNLSSRSSKGYIFFFWSYAFGNLEAIKQFKQKLRQKLEQSQWAPTDYKLELYAFLGDKEQINVCIKFEGLKNAYDHYAEVIEVLHRYSFMREFQALLLEDMNLHHDKQLDFYKVSKKLNTHQYKMLLNKMDTLPSKERYQDRTFSDSEKNIADEAKAFNRSMLKVILDQALSTNALSTNVHQPSEKNSENNNANRANYNKGFGIKETVKLPQKGISGEQFKNVLAKYHSSSFLASKWSPFDAVRSHEIKALKKLAYTLGKNETVLKTKLIETLRMARTCFNQVSSRKRLHIFLTGDAKNSKKATDKVLEELGQQFKMN